MKIRAQIRSTPTDLELSRATGSSVSTIRAWRSGRTTLSPGAVDALHEAGYGHLLGSRKV